jgi:hypothetical protein
MISVKCFMHGMANRKSFDSKASILGET